MSASALSDAERARAAELGVSVDYEDWAGRRRECSTRAVRLVLAMLDDGAPPTVTTIVCTAGAPRSLPRAPARTARVVAEDGTTRDVPIADGVVTVPPDLPLGYHRLQYGERDDVLVVAPSRCHPLPDTPVWGWSLQLPALRSRRSWGTGELADLRSLGTWSARSLGAAFVLVNPLHASTPVPPVNPSPYSPTSRRWFDPTYASLDDLPEIESLDSAGRTALDAARAAGRALGRTTLLDRDGAFAARRRAWDVLVAAPRSPARQQAFEAFVRDGGQELTRYATWCALAEAHGVPWQDWPVELHDPTGPAVAQARAQHAQAVERHQWLQWVVHEQLLATQRATREAGMPIGVVHDLAVGVDPGGADAWAQQDVLASAASIGAPPDSFSQRGQVWALPPWRPDRLRASGYAAFAATVRAQLAHGGGMRLDHAVGLWRLWWVPEGLEADEGVYVTNPAEDLLGVLALESRRAGSVVVAEDLGTVPAHIPPALRARGIASSAVLWFERDEHGWPRAGWDYPREVLASVTTHDLPTARGFWRGTATALRAELDLFPDAAAAAAAAETDRVERGASHEHLRTCGFVGEHPTEDDLVVGLHAYLARTPARLLTVALGDAVGEVRQANLPGTTGEAYPSWQLPLTDPAGELVGLADAVRSERLHRLVDAVRAGRTAAAHDHG